LTGYSSIAVYYQTHFAMTFHHKYSVTELNEMYPYERDLYLTMIAQHIDEQNKKNGSG
jgi:hypothetical protein